MFKAVHSLLAAVALFAAQSIQDPWPALGQETRGPDTTAAPATDGQTAVVVDAAKAFLATLSEQQRAALSFDFKDAEQRARWSNLPVGIVNRAGVAWGEMNEAQRAALTHLLGTVLGAEGVQNIREQMAADDTLALPSSGGPGGGRVRFGSDYYYVSFLGQPSTTLPWMLQFGGHHLGVNATVLGPNLTLSPSLTGGQPLKFVVEGRPVYIVLKEAVHGAALLNSLTDAQRKKAIIGSRFIDLVLGPGKDGMTLQPEGLPGAEMDKHQKAQLRALIEARLNILMNPAHRAGKMAEIETNLDQTYFAWWGPAVPLGAAYWRVTGPTVLLEFSPQALGGDPTQHAHNMYRDPTNEYGAAWTSLK